MRLRAKKSQARLASVGQAMLFALFILAVFGALSAGLAAMWESEMRTRASDRDSLIALYLTQAGIERAKMLVLSGYWAPGTYTIASQNGLDVAGDNYQFLYDIGITNSGGTARTLIGTGRVLDLSGNELARREIQITVNGISDILPLDGLDDNMSGSPQAWSWREI
ncbi:hypothetical protein EPN16_01895 [bacterium]|nr:MAG: hypothetical protein EPN16_01895 [bacterium]